jgi:hypothetical protein
MTTLNVVFNEGFLFSDRARGTGLRLLLAAEGLLKPIRRSVTDENLALIPLWVDLMAGSGPIVPGGIFGMDP